VEVSISVRIRVRVGVGVRVTIWVRAMFWNRVIGGESRWSYLDTPFTLQGIAIPDEEVRV